MVPAAYRPLSIIIFMIMKVVIIMNIRVTVIRPMIDIMGPYPETDERRVIEIVIIIAMVPTIITGMINKRVIVMVQPVKYVTVPVKVQFHIRWPVLKDQPKPQTPVKPHPFSVYPNETWIVIVHYIYHRQRQVPA